MIINIEHAISEPGRIEVIEVFYVPPGVAMLTSVAMIAVRAPRWILAITLVLCGFAVILGTSASKHLSSGGLIASNSPSDRADRVLTGELNSGSTLVILVNSINGPDNPPARNAGLEIISRLRTIPDIEQITSYWTAQTKDAAYLRGANGRSALIAARLAGGYSTQAAAAKAVDRAIRAVVMPAGVTASVGGTVLINIAVNNQITKDLATADLISVPLAAAFLLLVFGSLIAALIPLAVGVFAIAGALALLRALTALTSISVFALNLTAGLGLALAIDYSLLMVNRYREEVNAGLDRTEAVICTVQKAGRAILFSALVVGSSLSVLQLFPLYVLTSVAYAGIAVVGLAATAAIVVVPALLTVFGSRVDALDVRRPVRRLFGRAPVRAVTVEQSFWYRIAGMVIRHPVPIGIVVIEFLLLLGTPFLSVRFGPPDDRVLPTSASVRQVGDALRAEYISMANETTIVLPDRRGVSDGEIARYAASLSQLPRVVSVVAPTGRYQAGSLADRPTSGVTMANRQAAYLIVYAAGSPYGSAGSQVRSEISRLRAPAQILLTGSAAENADSIAALRARVPLALVLICVATFIVLCVLTGSMLLPLKAIVVNALSLTATFGAMVWVFQDGHLLGSLFGSTSSGYLVPEVPILMFCISFGISMDYEVFLLSRIHEEWISSNRTAADNTRAVQLGLARTGRIITVAAVLMAIVFASMAFSKVSILQLFGLGLTIAVLVDASLVRCLLVPAFMQVAGRANWWFPELGGRRHTHRPQPGDSVTVRQSGRVSEE